MVSYVELIYNFADIYLKTATECSICKESYTMADDTEFLDEYMKFFSSLLLSVEQDENLELETLKETLRKRKQEKIIEFQAFLKQKTIEAALESAKKYEHIGNADINDDMYIGEIRKFYNRIFDEDSKNVEEKPMELLRYMRDKEEHL